MNSNLRRVGYAHCCLAISFTLLLISVAGSQDASPRSAKIAGSNYDQLRTGDSADGKIVVPTNQVLSPAGRQVTFSGRPTDIALSPDGRWLAVLENSRVAIIDPETGTIVSRVPLAGGGSLAGFVFSPDCTRLFASTV